MGTFWSEANKKGLVMKDVNYMALFGNGDLADTMALCVSGFQERLDIRERVAFRRFRYLTGRVYEANSGTCFLRDQSRVALENGEGFTRHTRKRIIIARI